MKKTLLFAGALSAPLAAPLSVVAAEPATLLEPVLVVTETRSPQPANRLPAATSVIDRAQIEASGAAHVVDVLRRSALLQVTDFYGDGSRAQIDARGFGETANANTLVLIDGRRMNNPDISTPDLNSISLKDVERIEIIEGSAGALYGDQAVGGVINIVTRTPTQPRYVVEAEAGRYDAYGLRASAEDGRHALGWRLSGEARRRDNYRAHNELDYSNLLGRLDYTLASGTVFAEAGYVAEDLQTPGALLAAEVQADRRGSNPSYAGDFSDTRTTSGRLGFDHGLGAGWRALGEATYRQSDGRFRLSFAGAPATQDSTQDRKLWSFNPRLTRTLALPAGEGLLTVGVDAQRAQYLLVSPFGPQRNRQDQGDAYARVTVPVGGKVEVTAGVRASRLEGRIHDTVFTQSQDYDDDQTAGEIGAQWRPLEGLRLFARADRNYRYAKIDELSGAVPFGGVPGILLDTQTGLSLEAGAEWRRGAFHTQLSLYRLSNDQEIAFDPATFTNLNFDRTRRDGVTAQADWQLSPALNLSAGARHVDARFDSGSLQGRDIPLVADTSGNVGISWQALPALTLYGEALAVSSRVAAGDTDNSLPRLPGYGVLNAHAAWRRNAWSVSLRLNNLLDREYSEYGSTALDSSFSEVPAYFPSPGINGRLSLAYAW